MMISFYLFFHPSALRLLPRAFFFAFRMEHFELAEKYFSSSVFYMN